MYIAVKGDILKCSPTLGGILKRIVGFTSLFIPSLHIYLYPYILKVEAVTEKLILRLSIYLFLLMTIKTTLFVDIYLGICGLVS